MLVLSNISFPGPEAKHISIFPGHVYWLEQFFPENSHFGPRVFGETSPRLVEAKAATNWPYDAKKKQHSVYITNMRVYVFVKKITIDFINLVV